MENINRNDEFLLPLNRQPRPILIRDHNLLGEFDPNQVYNGNYRELYQHLNNSMKKYAFNILLDIYLIGWASYYLTAQLTDVLYYTEKLWLLSFVYFQFFAYLFPFFSAWIAKCNPKLVLNSTFMTWLFKVYQKLMILGLLAYFNVLFVDIEKYIFVGLGF